MARHRSYSIEFKRQVTQEFLGEFVRDSIQPGSTVHTDGWKGYASLERAGYEHRVSVTHGGPVVTEAAEFPRVHLVSSLLKRWLLETHDGSVGSKHLQWYLDEFTSRPNRRKARHVGKICYRLAEQFDLTPTCLPIRHLPLGATLQARAKRIPRLANFAKTHRHGNEDYCLGCIFPANSVKESLH